MGQVAGSSGGRSSSRKGESIGGGQIGLRLGEGKSPRAVAPGGDDGEFGAEDVDYSLSYTALRPPPAERGGEDYGDDVALFEEISALNHFEPAPKMDKSSPSETLGVRGLVGEHSGLNIDSVLEDSFEGHHFETREDVMVPYDLAMSSVKSAYQTLDHVSETSIVSLAFVEDVVVELRRDTRKRYDSALIELKEKSMMCIEKYRIALGHAREQAQRRSKDDEKERSRRGREEESNEHHIKLEALKQEAAAAASAAAKAATENRQVVQGIAQIAKSDPEFLPNYVKLMDKLSVWQAALVIEQDPGKAKKLTSKIAKYKVRVIDLLEMRAREKLQEQQMSIKDGNLDIKDSGSKEPFKEEKSHNNQNRKADDEAAQQLFESQQHPPVAGERSQNFDKTIVDEPDAQNQAAQEEQLVAEEKEEQKSSDVIPGEASENERAGPFKKVESALDTEPADVQKPPEKKLKERPRVISRSAKIEQLAAEEQEEQKSKDEIPDAAGFESKTAEFSEKVKNTESANVRKPPEKNVQERPRSISRSAHIEQPDKQTNSGLERYAKKLKVSEEKVKEMEKQLRQARVKANQMEQKLKLAENGNGAQKDDSKKIKQQQQHQHQQHQQELKKELKEKKGLEKQLRLLESKCSALEMEKVQLEGQATELKGSNTALADARRQLAQLEKANADLLPLQAKTAELESSLQAIVADRTELEEMYNREQTLRKKYYNMIEDMKGKIRVFARCRPMAQYEKERGCDTVTLFADDSMTLNVQASAAQNNGKALSKEFVFDHVFGPESTQAEVFEDTQRLVQSSLDGFNVCVFAYGQTGSGKTWTMVGSPEQPGIVRRSVSSIFDYKKSQQGKRDVVVRLYMMELYLDNLVDLLYKVIRKSDPDSVPKDAPKLEIKKDKSGTVFVKGAQIITVETEQDLLEFFEKANSVRKVSATKMNAGSSRSHLVFSVVLENTDLATKKTTVGKLSLVDLAGSERQDKTGASGDQLKEAMSINKSLSALGDVISALSTNESFIPYRNNKLTQLMSDSLGGNAKTLMFVNISPADYNVEETVSSLTYAQRVKLITNDANKSEQNEQVTTLLKIVKELTAAGATSETLESSNITT